MYMQHSNAACFGYEILYIDTDVLCTAKNICFLNTQNSIRIYYTRKTSVLRNKQNKYPSHLVGLVEVAQHAVGAEGQRRQRQQRRRHQRQQRPQPARAQRTPRARAHTRADRAAAAPRHAADHLHQRADVLQHNTTIISLLNVKLL